MKIILSSLMWAESGSLDQMSAFVVEAAVLITVFLITSGLLFGLRTRPSDFVYLLHACLPQAVALLYVSYLMVNGET